MNTKLPAESRAEVLVSIERSRRQIVSNPWGVVNMDTAKQPLSAEETAATMSNDRYRIILHALAEAKHQRLSEAVLNATVRKFGHHVTGEVTLGDMTALEREGLLQIEPAQVPAGDGVAAPSKVALLTRAGRRWVVDQKAAHERARPYLEKLAKPVLSGRARPGGS